MLLRPLRADDADAAADAHAAAFDAPWSAVELAALIADPAVFGIGGFDGLALAGFILCRTAADESEILTLAVRPDLRGRGAGAALVDAAVTAARARGAASMFLEVAADNAAALSLYRRVGFVGAGARRAYYARSDGGRVDALVMKRSLNTGAG